MEFLASHNTGVLSWMGPDGFLIAVRVPFRADPSRREIAIEAFGLASPILEGRACAWPSTATLQPCSATCRSGNLTRSVEGWRLVPRRIVGGFEVPEGRISRFRDFVKKGPGFYRTQAPPSRGAGGRASLPDNPQRSERVSSRPPASSRREGL